MQKMYDPRNEPWNRKTPRIEKVALAVIGVLMVVVSAMMLMGVANDASEAEKGKYPVCLDVRLDTMTDRSVYPPRPKISIQCTKWGQP
jgi:hypothetical protein